MIAAQDLMIGDIVDVHRSECVADGGHYMQWNEYGKIVCITDCYITIKYIGREDDYSWEDVEEKDINPIPLTAEILEKNGFEYKEADETCATEAFHHWHLVGSRFAIDDDSWWCSVKDGELHVKFGGFPLKFVHQLQHALRLCGIDKKIEV